MSKIILISGAFFILVITALSIAIKVLNKKVKSQKETIDTLYHSLSEKENEINKIKGEIEIERRHKNELAKKLADIERMSIDDVLQQLQNGKSS